MFALMLRSLFSAFLVFFVIFILNNNFVHNADGFVFSRIPIKKDGEELKEYLTGIFTLRGEETLSVEGKVPSDSSSDSSGFGNIRVTITKTPVFFVYDLNYQMDVFSDLKESIFEYPYKWKMRNWENSKDVDFQCQADPDFHKCEDGNVESLYPKGYAFRHLEGRCCWCKHLSLVDSAGPTRSNFSCGSTGVVRGKAYLAKHCPKILGPWYSGFSFGPWNWRFNIDIVVEWFNPSNASDDAKNDSMLSGDARVAEFKCLAEHFGASLKIGGEHQTISSKEAQEKNGNRNHQTAASTVISADFVDSAVAVADFVDSAKEEEEGKEEKEKEGKKEKEKEGKEEKEKGSTDDDNKSSNSVTVYKNVGYSNEETNNDNNDKKDDNNDGDFGDFEIDDSSSRNARKNSATPTMLYTATSTVVPSTLSTSSTNSTASSLLMGKGLSVDSIRSVHRLCRNERKKTAVLKTARFQLNYTTPQIWDDQFKIQVKITGSQPQVDALPPPLNDKYLFVPSFPESNPIVQRSILSDGCGLYNKTQSAVAAVTDKQRSGPSTATAAERETESEGGEGDEEYNKIHHSSTSSFSASFAPVAASVTSATSSLSSSSKYNALNSSNSQNLRNRFAYPEYPKKRLLSSAEFHKLQQQQQQQQEEKNCLSESLFIPSNYVDLTGKTCNVIGTSLSTWSNSNGIGFCNVEPGYCMGNQIGRLRSIDENLLLKGENPQFKLNHNSITGFPGAFPRFYSNYRSEEDEKSMEDKKPDGRINDKRVEKTSKLKYKLGFTYPYEHSTTVEIQLAAENIVWTQTNSPAEIFDIITTLGCKQSSASSPADPCPVGVFVKNLGSSNSRYSVSVPYCVDALTGDLSSDIDSISPVGHMVKAKKMSIFKFFMKSLVDSVGFYTCKATLSDNQGRRLDQSLFNVSFVELNRKFQGEQIPVWPPEIEILLVDENLNNGTAFSLFSLISSVKSFFSLGSDESLSSSASQCKCSFINFLCIVLHIGGCVRWLKSVVWSVAVCISSAIGLYFFGPWILFALRAFCRRMKCQSSSR